MLRQVLGNLFQAVQHSAPGDRLVAGNEVDLPLHLGCGSNVMPGWVNVDLEDAVGVFKWDLTQILPFADGTHPYVFNEHFIEHIDFSAAEQLVSECLRVLVPGGVLRLSTPNMKVLVAEYLAGRTDAWLDVGWAPSSPCRMMNEGMRRWGHTFLYDEEELRSLLMGRGFESVTEVRWRQSSDPMLRNLECRPYHGELIFEARKRV